MAISLLWLTNSQRWLWMIFHGGISDDSLYASGVWEETLTVKHTDCNQFTLSGANCQSSNSTYKRKVTCLLVHLHKWCKLSSDLQDVIHTKTLFFFYAIWKYMSILTRWVHVSLFYCQVCCACRASISLISNSICHSMKCLTWCCKSCYMTIVYWNYIIRH